MVKPTAKGVIALYEALTGKKSTAEAVAAMQARFEAIAARKAAEKAGEDGAAKKPRDDRDL
jgi:hypothetical protein